MDICPESERTTCIHLKQVGPCQFVQIHGQLAVSWVIRRESQREEKAWPGRLD